MKLISVDKCIILFLIKARWQSGYAAACKAVDVGSIPILASGLSPGGGIGRRYGLKIR